MNTLEAVTAAMQIVKLSLEKYDLYRQRLADANRERMIADGWSPEEVDAAEAFSADNMARAREEARLKLIEFAFALPIESLTAANSEEAA